MRQIRYLENSQEKTLDFNDDITPDLVGFNQNLINKNTEDLKGFKVYSKGHNVEVDLTNGNIKVDGNEIDLNIDPDTKAKLNIENLRWINFNRKAVSYRMTGLISKKSVAYGIGWQADVDGENIKRFVLVTREGFTLEA